MTTDALALRPTCDSREQPEARIGSRVGRIEQQFRKRLAAHLIAALLPAVPAGATGVLERLESAAQLMGSEFRIACYAPSKKLAAGAITAAFDEVRRVDDLLSHYKSTSELSRVNREAGKGVTPVTGEFAGLLAACQRYAEQSEGAFDITVGALVDAWGFYKGQGSKPSRFALWRAKRNSGFRYLELDTGRRTVRFLRPGLQLDPGGIGKGYAVERAVRVLREYGIERALVSSGTSSIFALGAPPGQPLGWNLSLRSTSAPRDAAATITLRDQALSTSGSYEKYFDEGGRRYGHIIDPRTGQPSEGVAAVSVIAASATDAEAWSTAFFVNGAEWARAHTLEGSRVYLCDSSGACGWLGEE